MVTRIAKLIEHLEPSRTHMRSHGAGSYRKKEEGDLGMAGSGSTAAQKGKEKKEKI